MGCIISKKKSPKRNHHHQRKESSEKRSSSRIDDSSQSKEEQQDRSKFSSTRLSPEIAEIGDTDEDEDTELKREPSTVVAKEEPEVAAGWPAWLVSVAGEALVGWTPRRASTFEKLEKVSIQFGSFFRMVNFVSMFLLCRLDKARTAVSTRRVISWITRLLRLKESGLISAI